MLRNAATMLVARQAGIASCSYSTVSEASKSAFSYCVQQVRQFDYDNYVWMVQQPKELRPALFAVRAFNIETAQIADHAKELQILKLRFQWWRDAVTGLYQGQFPRNPVMIALAEVLGSGKQLNKYHFRRMIDTREQDLVDRQPPLSTEGLEKYGEGTASQVLYLQLEAAGISSKDADHAASHLGKAVGIATLLRGTPVHASGKRSYLPIDLCAEYKVSQEDVYSGNVTEGMRDVALKVASLAKAHLDEARALQPKVPKGARPLLLPAIACGKYLEALEKSNFDLFDPRLLKGGYTPIGHTLSIKWHLIKGTY